MAGEQQDRRFLGDRRTRLIIVRVCHIFPDGIVQKCAGLLEEPSTSLDKGRPARDLLVHDTVYQGSGATARRQDGVPAEDNASAARACEGLPAWAATSRSWRTSGSGGGRPNLRPRAFAGLRVGATPFRVQSNRAQPININQQPLGAASLASDAARHRADFSRLVSPVLRLSRQF